MLPLLPPFPPIGKPYQKNYRTGKVGKETRSRSGKNLPVGRSRRTFDRQRVHELRSQGLSPRRIASKLGLGKERYVGASGLAGAPQNRAETLWWAFYDGRQIHGTSRAASRPANSLKFWRIMESRLSEALLPGGTELMPSHPQATPARVFISCGQTTGTDELETAREIANRLVALEFDPYIALQEQTLLGLRENIFERLAYSEYFVFVDFKREQLMGVNPPAFRGSLFSHQELALASYLEMPLLAFQETGVKRDDGILRFLQANAIQFSDRHLLPNVVADKIRERKWDPHWRNELVLERNDPTQHGDAKMCVRDEPRMARFFHIGVLNRHRSKFRTPDIPPSRFVRFDHWG
jgi:hypothetical protein